MSKRINSQMLREIEELKTIELYRAYHNAAHMEKYHVRIDDNWLRNRLFQGPAVPDELIISSKFTIPMQEIVDDIYACITKNLKDLNNWNVYREDLALSIPLGKVIGYGFVQRTDTTHPFQMSAIRVILSAPVRRGRLFYVKTAYPVPDMDEVDEVWDAKEAYEERLFHRLKLREEGA